MFHPDVLYPEGSFLGGAPYVSPKSTTATPARGAFTPEKAVHKSHKALAALDGLSEEEGISVREISHRSGLSTRDLGRIMNRLSAAGRVSRSKDGSSGCFRYWLDNDQRKRFRAEFRVVKVAGNMRVRPMGDIRLDELANTHARLLTSRQDIEREKARLERQIAQVRVELAQGLNELDDAKALLARERSRLTKLQREIKKERQGLGRMGKTQVQALATLGEVVIKKEKRTATATPTLAQIDPTDLSATLSFVRQLRKRPALADMAQLAKIETDYQNALRLACAEED